MIHIFCRKLNFLLVHQFRVEQGFVGEDIPEAVGSNQPEDGSSKDLDFQLQQVVSVNNQLPGYKLIVGKN